MTARTDKALLRLQQELTSLADASRGETPPELLSFQVGTARYSVPCAEVLRLQMPVDVIQLAGYPQLPDCVVGAVGSENEMLSVVDAGLLLDGQRVSPGLKSRLIVFSDGPLKGVALLVDRVGDRLERSTAPADMTHHDAASLQSALQGKADAKRLPA